MVSLRASPRGIRVAARRLTSSRSSQLSVKTASVRGDDDGGGRVVSKHGYRIGFELIFTMDKIKNGIDLPSISVPLAVSHI